MKKAKDLKYFVVFPAYSEAREDAESNIAKELIRHGIDVTLLGIPVSNWWPYPTLDAAVKNGNAILRIYDMIDKYAPDKDHVIFVAGGSMFHENFLKSVKGLTFAHFGDDPESSEIL